MIKIGKQYEVGDIYKEKNTIGIIVLKEKWLVNSSMIGMKEVYRDVYKVWDITKNRMAILFDGSILQYYQE